jgi:hypothetical protein
MIFSWTLFKYSSIILVFLGTRHQATQKKPGNQEKAQTNGR